MRHQAVPMEIIRQINVFLTRHPIGQLLAETDMHLGRAKGRDFVYRPEVLFMTAEHWARPGDRLVGPPALAVEVVSQGSRRYDRITKKADYERFGVLEYWLMDPEREAMTFWRLRAGRYVEIEPEGKRFVSEAIPGFALDLAKVRKIFSRSTSSGRVAPWYDPSVSARARAYEGPPCARFGAPVKTGGHGMTDERISYRVCPLCEATCGLEIRSRGREVVSIRGDEADVFSRGFICPKAYALKELDADPDRLRTPLVRRNGTLEPATWDAAFAEIGRRLVPIIRERGRDAVAVYLGNPSVHSLALSLYGQVFLRALGTKNLFSASTVDQMPKQVAVGLMFGTMLSTPVPDLDRTDYLLVLGANPFVSNGSLMTAPDVPGRLRAIRRRGGRVVVADPRRTRTAAEASEHHFIRPGTDAYFLFGIVHALFADDLVRLGRLAEHTAGLEQVETLARPFAPEAVAGRCGIDAATIRRVARELAQAERAAVYARIGTCTQEFGTLASWLVDVINVLTGHLDQVGGAMFTRAATGSPHTRGTPGKGRGVRFGRRRSRVREAPEVYGELPVACLAEEIEAPGKGQIRALVTVAGNPVLSTPNGARLDRALASLEFMVSLDIYLNETTRHADVILPGLSPLEQSHYDVILRQLAIRNVATYSPPTFDPPAGHPPEWQTVLRLAAIVAGQEGADIAALDDFVVMQRVEQEVAAPASPIHGRDPAEILSLLAARRGPERLLDLLLRTGPYGDAFGANPGGLSLAVLEASPHGIDLGPLEPRIPEVLRTPSGRIELAPEPIAADVERLRAALERPARADGEMVLIGRRDLRSNNSWMHNLRVLVKGNPRCTAQLHPTDAVRLGIASGELARVTSRVGAIELPVEVTDAVMPGVVSIPHGWGHDMQDIRLHVASAHAGANSNRLADELALDPLSGNAVLNGLRVAVERAVQPASP